MNKVNVGAKLSSVVSSGFMHSFDNPSNFYAKVLSMQVGVLKDLKDG